MANSVSGRTFLSPQYRSGCRTPGFFVLDFFGQSCGEVFGITLADRLRQSLNQSGESRQLCAEGAAVSGEVGGINNNSEDTLNDSEDD